MLRQEGEIWTERGKTWTMKNGIKKTVTKFTQVRKNLQTPICCPKCSKPMKHFDEQIYKFNNVCLNCTVEFEHELRKLGKYDEYERVRVLANAKGYVIDLDKFFSEYFKDSSNKGFITEDGDIEAWIGNTTKRVEEIVKPELDKLKKQLDL